VNVTIALPDDLMREARHEAVDKGVSLSRYVAMVLEETLETRRRHRRARAEARRIMDQGLLLGTEGRITWTRDELHER
jgi:hypothetical protein